MRLSEIKHNDRIELHPACAAIHGERYGRIEGAPCKPYRCDSTVRVRLEASKRLLAVRPEDVMSVL